MEQLDQAVAWLNELTGVGFSLHGWIAFVLGVVGVVVLNVGLMRLVIRSNRSGHDLATDAFVRDRDSERPPR